MAQKEDPNEPEPIGSRLEASLPLMFRLRGTMILKIWWQVLCATLYTAGVIYIHLHVEGYHMNFPMTLVQLMGVVCGLLLAFRSNTAYDRYWEGRKTWSTMTQGIRTLTRCIWVNIKEEGSKDIVEKKSAINLLVAFAIATKHYLREEYSYDYPDLKSVTGHILQLRLHTPSSTQPLGKQQPAAAPYIASVPEVPDTTLDLDPESHEDPTASETDKKTKKGKKGKKAKKPVIVKSKPKEPKVSASAKSYKYKAHDIATPTNIPIELSYYIASYINWVRIRERCDSGTLGAMSAGLNSMMECLATFERILRTPIPLAYSVHLHQSIWLYIIALPFQLAHPLGWWAVVVVGITSFFLLGILGIGWEIENPFGYDDNDLPLDDFCKVLRREVEVIVSQKPLNPEEWMFSSENQPFQPECVLDAIELSEKPMDEVREIIVNRGSQISLNHSNLFETATDGKRRSTKKRKGPNDDQEEGQKMLPYK